jgi:hypothetical protein
LAQAAFGIDGDRWQLDIGAADGVPSFLSDLPQQIVIAVGTCWEATRFAVMMNPMMMTNERKIWEAALLLVRRHGAEAAEIARQEVQRLQSGDDELTCVVWCWIARSTAELLRPFPDKGERIH